MTDWRDKAKNHIENQEASRKKVEEGKLAQEKTKRKLADENAALQIQKQIEQLSRNFKCHICGKSATKPHTESVYIPGPGKGVNWDGEPTGHNEIVTNSKLPGDLFRCSKCNKWTCEEHIAYGICMYCAERL